MRGIVAILRAVFFAWVPALIEIVRRLSRWCRRLHDRRVDKQGSRAHCVPIDHPAFRRPDPLIYDQYYLIGLGLAVTWDNPDIEILQGGVPVPAGKLNADTHYEVRVRVWNASLDALVVQMPVRLSYLSFGIGTVSNPIDTRLVSVGVVGAASQPGFVSFDWHTPPQPGHYCLQALLDPADDANFANNLGQKNTDVGLAHSPATFQFELRNATRRPHRYRFTVDSYVIPPLGPCFSDRRPTDGVIKAEQQRRLAVHLPSAHLLPPGWKVDISPDHPSLEPSEQLTVTVVATPPEGWTGQQALNVNTFDEGDKTSGGVTLIVLGT
ncbi:hypothetical protein [Rhizobium mayense]|uniref:CARDB domain-containing protein n=1 Tax=Rhizobium mayense TaxID=1312184 RepID=A0ABT7JYU1_9HYPH|nr:hypothetical protein [Rhizobium mayense]MDL2401102.1 hypothetical protein [Rhizobium mayense]